MTQPCLVVDMPKESDPGEFVLVVARPGGGILGQHVFFVDRLTHSGFSDAAFVRGWRGDQLETEFPMFIPYVLINRRQTSFVDEPASTDTAPSPPPADMVPRFEGTGMYM